MMRFVLPCAALAAALVVSLPAYATGTLTRTFVSSSGVDTNPCTIAAPCATFATAYAAVAPNGIVAALDPGKYGPLTITGAVTIDGNGWAAITAPSGGSGILIQAEASDNVILRGITVDGGGGSPNNGIEFDSGASLTVINCIARNVNDGNLVAEGLLFYNNGSSAETLTVADSQFVNNGFGNGGRGVTVQAVSSGGITASFVRTQFSGNDVGLTVAGNSGSGAAVSASVTDSVAANNGQIGFQSSATANLFLTKNQIVGNATGIEPQGNNLSVVWLAQSTVAGNATAAFRIFDNAVLNSYGNNYFANNGSNTGSLTPVGTQ